MDCAEVNAEVFLTRRPCDESQDIPRDKPHDKPTLSVARGWPDPFSSSRT
jgi:hypothetical protein